MMHKRLTKIFENIRNSYKPGFCERVIYEKLLSLVYIHMTEILISLLITMSLKNLYPTREKNT